MSLQQPQFWPAFKTDRFRFSPVFKGSSWLAVLKAEDIEGSLSKTEVSRLLELGFMQGSQGRFIYPHHPDTSLVESVNELFSGTLEVLTTDKVVVLHGSTHLQPAIPSDMINAIAWLYANKTQMLGMEIRRSLQEDTSEEAEDLLARFSSEQFINPDRLRGWVSEALDGEVTPVTEPILGLAVAKVIGAYNDEPPEEILYWLNALAIYRGDDAASTVELNQVEALKASPPAPEIGELVSWNENNDKVFGRVISHSEDYPGSVWIAPSISKPIQGLLIPSRVRVDVANIEGYRNDLVVEQKPAVEPTIPEANNPAMVTGKLSLDDVPSDYIRALKDNGLNSDRVKRTIRGVFKAGLIQGVNPFISQDDLKPRDMVTHWHFVRRDLDAELGGETPQVLDATAFIRDELLSEFNNAQPELPGAAANVLAVLPVYTTRMGASEEMGTEATQEKIDRETVYGIGLHPAFIRSLDRQSIVDRVEELNDKRTSRALYDTLKAFSISALDFSTMVVTADRLRKRRVQQMWANYVPDETPDSEYEDQVTQESRGQLFFSAKSAGAFLVDALNRKGNTELANKNEAVIRSVIQLSGESHSVIEALPHPLFMLAEEVKKAGGLESVSTSNVLAILNIDLSQSIGVMGDLARLSGIALPIVNKDLIQEPSGKSGQLVPRSELIAGVMKNAHQGPRPFSLAITATDEVLTPSESPQVGAQYKYPMLQTDDEAPFDTMSVGLGYLVNINMISPLRFGDEIGSNMVLNDEAVESIEPNWFELDNFNALYEKRSLRNTLDAADIQKADGVPTLGGSVKTSVADISNSLGTIEKGMQAVIGSWRSEDKARELLIDGIAHWLGNNKHFKASGSNDKLATSLADDLIQDTSGEMIALVSKKTSRSIRYRSITVSTEQIGQSQYDRQEAAELATLQFKNRNSAYRKYHTDILDAMSILRPEALKYLNDQRLKMEKAQAISDSASKKGETDKKGRQNRGLVAGLSIKDLRGKSDVVLNHLSGSNELDMQKLCKKTKLWPAPDWTSLRMGDADSDAMEPAVAEFFSRLRKALPSASPVNAKRINLLYAKAILQVRDAFSDVRTVDELKERIKTSLGSGFRQVEDESAEIGVSPGLILGSFGHWVNPGEYMMGILERSVFRTRQNEEWPSHLIQKRAASRNGGQNDFGAMPTLKRLVRQGTDYRAGQDIDEETLITTFGFSGVEYGQSMPQSERTTYLNHAYDGFRDLADALEVNPKSLSLGGTLGLAFGSRGHGGRRAALAHFEPSNNVINLTRMKGAGSMAHEYGHALANYFSRMVSGQARGPGDLAESVSGGYSFKPMNKDMLGGLRKEIYDAFAVIMANTRYRFSDEKTAFNLAEMGKQYAPDSDLMRGARLADEDRQKKYWSSPAEMFARSFETWIHEKLQAKDSTFQNDFLVRADKLKAWSRSLSEQGKDASGDAVKPQLYPSGDQLTILSKAFQSLVKSLREGTKRVDHEHLGEVDLPYFYSRDTGSIQRLQKEDMGPVAQCVIGELARMCGPGIELQFKQDLKDDHGSSVAGRFVSIEGPDYQPSNGIRGVMEMAYGAPMSVAWHEAFHFAQTFLLTNEERDMLDFSFSVGSELYGRLIDSLIESGKENLVEYCDNPKEAQAYAYEQWVDGALKLSVEEQPRTLFGEIKSFLSKALGLSEKAGFSSPEQLFQAFYDGRLAARANLQESLSSVSSDKYQTLELSRSEFQEAGADQNYLSVHAPG